jgi:hypothetical protein
VNSRVDDGMFVSGVEWHSYSDRMSNIKGTILFSKRESNFKLSCERFNKQSITINKRNLSAISSNRGSFSNGTVRYPIVVAASWNRRYYSTPSNKGEVALRSAHEKIKSKNFQEAVPDLRVYIVHISTDMSSRRQLEVIKRQEIKLENVKVRLRDFF